MSEDELARSSSLLEEGVYPFEVISASETISKTGNEMIKIKLNVFGQNGQQAHVLDYLLEKLAFKLRHFCEVTGLLPKYDNGSLSELDCEGKQGWLKLKVEPATGGYSAKNSVADYVNPPTAAAPVAAPVAEKVTPDVPRTLTPAEFNAKHGMNPKAVLDDFDILF